MCWTPVNLLPVPGYGHLLSRHGHLLLLTTMYDDITESYANKDTVIRHIPTINFVAVKAAGWLV